MEVLVYAAVRRFASAQREMLSSRRLPVRQPLRAYMEILLYSDSAQREMLSSRRVSLSEKSAYFWEKLADSLIFEQDGYAVVRRCDASLAQ